MFLGCSLMASIVIGLKTQTAVNCRVLYSIGIMAYLVATMYVSSLFLTEDSCVSDQHSHFYYVV